MAGTTDSAAVRKRLAQLQERDAEKHTEAAVRTARITPHVRGLPVVMPNPTGHRGGNLDAWRVFALLASVTRG